MLTLTMTALVVLGLLNLRLRSRWVALIAVVGSVLSTLLLEVGDSLSVWLPISWHTVCVVTETSLVFARVISILMLVATALALEYYRRNDLFFSWIVVLNIAMLGVAFSQTWYSLLLFWELITIVGFFLIWPTSRQTAKQYLLIQLTGAGLLLLTAARVVSVSGTTVIEAPVPPHLYPWFVIAMGFKFGLIGIHFWLPTAHSSASAPGSSILSGVIVKVGIFGLYKVGVVGYQPLVLVGITMIVWGGLRALIERDLKRLLAFSTVSQLGYLVLCLGGTNAYVFVALMIYMLHHGLAKMLLFMAAGLVQKVTGTRDLYELRGIYRKSGFIAVVFVAGTASLAGLPLTLGYVAKSMLKASVKGYHLTEIFFALSILTFLYLGRMHLLMLGHTGDRLTIQKPVEPVALVLALSLPMWILSSEVLVGRAVGNYMEWGFEAVLSVVIPLLVALALARFLPERILQVTRRFVENVYASVLRMVGSSFGYVCTLSQSLHTGYLNDYIMYLLISLGGLLLFFYFLSP